MTYPLIGNYGTASVFEQSRQSFVKGFVVGELCGRPSSWQTEQGLADYIVQRKIPCLSGVDTRAVTRLLRSQGAMQGIIAPEGANEETLQGLLAENLFKNHVEQATISMPYKIPGSGPHVAVLDFGIKKSILTALNNRLQFDCNACFYKRCRNIKAKPGRNIFIKWPRRPQGFAGNNSKCKIFA